MPLSFGTVNLDFSNPNKESHLEQTVDSNTCGVG